MVKKSVSKTVHGSVFPYACGRALVGKRNNGLKNEMDLQRRVSLGGGLQDRIGGQPLR